MYSRGSNPYCFEQKLKKSHQWSMSRLAVAPGEADRTVSIDRKGKGKAKIQHCNAQVGGYAAVTIGSGGNFIAPASAKVGIASIGRYNWAWKENAIYQDINLGFRFGLDRPSES
jgi:hypothetical protein